MKYRVSYMVTGLTSVDVEADSEKAAVEAAEEEMDYIQLCWQCSDVVEMDDINFDQDPLVAEL